MLKLIRYNTMNSWNNSTAPAFNLKVYNVIPSKLQDRVYELMDTEEFYDEINDYMRTFEREYNYEWQVGFNGRSSGYLVLYKGGIHEDGRTFCFPGKAIDLAEVPREVIKSFSKLAENIVKHTINMAKYYKVVTKEIKVSKKIRVIEIV